MQVPPNSPNADADCLVHGLLNVHDLQDRRFDVWITDFPGATHLLDVYCNKRVDKRKAFPSQYARLEQLEERYRPQVRTGAIRCVVEPAAVQGMRDVKCAIRCVVTRCAPPANCRAVCLV